MTYEEFITYLSKQTEPKSARELANALQIRRQRVVELIALGKERHEIHVISGRPPTYRYIESISNLRGPILTGMYLTKEIKAALTRSISNARIYYQP